MVDREYNYRKVRGTVSTNINTGIIYGQLLTHCYVQIPNSLEYHFKAASTEEEEGMFQQTVNQYLADIGAVVHDPPFSRGISDHPWGGVEYVEEETITMGYTLDYSIIGTPYTIKGTISLPTAKDVVILYIVNNSDLNDLKQTIDVCEGLLIKYDKAALWKTLPQWLKATITTINTMIDARYDGGMDNSDCYEVTQFIDLLTLEPPTDNLY